MAVDAKKYSYRLRQICEEYYRNNISYEEYRSQRDKIFDSIDKDQGMAGFGNEEDLKQEDSDIFDMDVHLTHE